MVLRGVFRYHILKDISKGIRFVGVRWVFKVKNVSQSWTMEKYSLQWSQMWAYGYCV